MILLGRGIVYDRSTACARGVSCENVFPRDSKTTYNSSVGVTVCTDTEHETLQYHNSLETAGDFEACLTAVGKFYTAHELLVVALAKPV